DALDDLILRKQMIDIIKQNPLDQKQKYAFEEIMKALAKPDLREVERVAGLFNRNPGRFQNVAEHVFVESRLLGIKYSMFYNPNSQHSGQISIAPDDPKGTVVKIQLGGK